MFDLTSRLNRRPARARRIRGLTGLFAASTLLHSGCAVVERDAQAEFSFAMTADMREFTGPKHAGPQYFEGACAALKDIGPGDFMLSPGDIDPPQAVRDTLDRVLGTNYVWYPVVGNHESETPADMVWLRKWGSGDIPGLVRRGPPGCEATTFSFDHGCAHFAVLNQYFDGRSDIGARGDVGDAIYEWLEADLKATRKPVVFVVGHEPIAPAPDMDNGRLRHQGDSLDAHLANNQRFHGLLSRHRVTAYLTAHTHNASVTNIAGVWQVDAGHARGLGDKGAPSTFMKLTVTDSASRVDIYRADSQGENYQLRKSVKLD